jgi:protein-tyrosine phosphatase
MSCAMSAAHSEPAAQLQNVRDVGGLAVEPAGRIRSGVLLRSDAPFVGDHPPHLESWPPRTVIDLRSAGEGGGPHPLQRGGAEVLSLPLLRGASLSAIAANLGDSFTELSAMYLQMLTGSSAVLVEAVRAIAHRPGPVLVHCSAGKDRTGVLLAVLLSALGVPDGEIMADYERTNANMEGVLLRILHGPGAIADAELLERMGREHPELLQASPPAIAAVLAALHGHEGGAAGWLLAHGLSEDDLVRVRGRLVDPT